MIWLDAHLSPRIALWIETELGHQCLPIRDVGLREAEDDEIFSRARDGFVIFMTKDQDFADLVTRLGAPPHVIWLRTGNTSEDRLKTILILVTSLNTKSRVQAKKSCYLILET